MSRHTNYEKLKARTLKELQRFPRIKADRLSVRLGIASYKIGRNERIQRNQVLLTLLKRLEKDGVIRLEKERFAGPKDFPFVYLVQEDVA